jgi:hypothetical protein
MDRSRKEDKGDDIFKSPDSHIDSLSNVENKAGFFNVLRLYYGPVFKLIPSQSVSTFK